MRIVNRKAYHEYNVLKEYTAGIQLFGSEVKSLANGDANLRDSYVFIFNHELYIKGFYIAKYKEANLNNHIEKRDRKLLLKKREIRSIEKDIKATGLTIIPLEIFPLNGKFKVKISIARGKKIYDKRASTKEKDLKRESENEH
jgi:SsrA-binding protein